jgi:hypothetical protein
MCSVLLLQVLLVILQATLQLGSYLPCLFVLQSTAAGAAGDPAGHSAARAVAHPACLCCNQPLSAGAAGDPVEGQY